MPDLQADTSPCLSPNGHTIISPVCIEFHLPDGRSIFVTDVTFEGSEFLLMEHAYPRRYRAGEVAIFDTHLTAEFMARYLDGEEPHSQITRDTYKDVLKLAKRNFYTGNSDVERRHYLTDDDLRALQPEPVPETRDLTPTPAEPKPTPDYRLPPDVPDTQRKTNEDRTGALIGWLCVAALALLWLCSIFDK